VNTFMKVFGYVVLIALALYTLLAVLPHLFSAKSTEMVALGIGIILLAFTAIITIVINKFKQIGGTNEAK